MLVFNRSDLKRECSVMNVLKFFASIVSVCNLCNFVISLSNITPRYCPLFANGIFRPFNVKRDSEVEK
jgi:hypothetical protein